MFDSSKQPDSESTIDFLHDDASSGSKLSKSKKMEPVEIEYVHDGVQDDHVNVRSSVFQSIARRIVSGVTGLFRKQPSASQPALDPAESSARSSDSSQSKADSDQKAPTDSFGLKSSSSKQDLRSDHRLDQAQPAIAGIKTKGRSIEKIPLNRFRDLGQPEPLKQDHDLDGRDLKGISFRKDGGGDQSEMDVNLLPEQPRLMSPRVKLGIAMTLLFFEFAGLLVGFLALQAKADGRLLGSRELESQKTLLDIQIKRYREVLRKASQLQQRAVKLRDVLEQRHDILGMLAWFESNTIDSVYLEGFSVSDKGDVHVRVVAPNAEDAAHQMNIFNATKSWKEARVSSIAFEQGPGNSPQVSFDVQLFGFIQSHE